MDLIALEISGDDGAGWEFLAMGRKNTHRQDQIGSQKSMDIFTLKIQFRSSNLLRFQSLHLPNTKNTESVNDAASQRHGCTSHVFGIALLCQDVGQDQ